TAATLPPTTAAPTSRAPVDTSWQKQMLDAVNAERAKAGVGPLALCGSLNRAAQGYADRMRAENFFSHTAPDGSTVETRLRAAGYGSGRTWGENIARGQTSVASVMQGWMNSAGHKANILRANFTHLGVGRSSSGNYWVQNFGAGGSC